MKDEVLKLALEALEGMYIDGFTMDDSPINNAITAIKQALADSALDRMAENARELGLDYEPVTWRNAAIRVGEDLCSVGPFGYYDMTAKQWLDWALSVVTVHAPPAQPAFVQEPVAWMHVQGNHEEPSLFQLDEGEVKRGWEQYPLYTTPPAAQRQWVGLTDQEMDNFVKAVWGRGVTAADFIRAIEAKIKERNT